MFIPYFATSILSYPCVNEYMPILKEEQNPLSSQTDIFVTD